jgi:hypothetical protein
VNSFLAPSAAGAALAFRGAGARSHGSARALSRYDGAKGKRTHPHALLTDYRSGLLRSQFVGTGGQPEPVWLYALYKDGRTRRRPGLAPGFAAAGPLRRRPESAAQDRCAMVYQLAHPRPPSLARMATAGRYTRAYSQGAPRPRRIRGARGAEEARQRRCAPVPRPWGRRPAREGIGNSSVIPAGPSPAVARTHPTDPYRQVEGTT